MSPRRAARPRHIVDMGGGGFSMERTPVVDRYVLGLTGKRRPRVAFVGTASGDSEGYAAKFERAFRRLGCRTAILPFFRRTPGLMEFVRAQDVLYVGGGNTRSLMAVWSDWGFPKALRAAWREGVVLAGVSAGANCWFQACNTDSSASGYLPVPCLGFLRGAFCPHYDGEPERRPSVQRMVRSGALPATLALEDGVAAHFVGTRLKRLISSRPRARGYRVERRAGRVVETALPVEVLPHG
jgi:peptidase E